MEREDGRTLRFLNTYAQLEEALRLRFYPKSDDGGVVSRALRDNFTEVRPFARELDLSREVRNLLAHNAKLDDEYLVTPAERLIESMEQLLLVLRMPPEVSEYAVRYQKIYTTQYSDRALQVMRVMHDKNYAHVPVVRRDNRLVGIFSECSIVAYLTHVTSRIAEDTPIEAFKRYISVTDHPNEVFLFARWDSTLYEVERLYARHTDHKRRLELIFFTEDGDPFSPILGFITSFDMLQTRVREAIDARWMVAKGETAETAEAK